MRKVTSKLQLFLGTILVATVCVLFFHNYKQAETIAIQKARIKVLSFVSINYMLQFARCKKQLKEKSYATAISQSQR